MGTSRRRSSPNRPSEPTGRFAAIDFETADNQHDSACALAIVVVDGTEVLQEEHFYIRPPRSEFRLTWVHQITWSDVAEAPRFCDLWPRVSKLLQGVDFVAAHNAGFDRSVLYRCCHGAAVSRPAHRFQCTVKLARQSWGVPRATLPHLCRLLDIGLQHHQAASDARACAEIVIAARKQGLPLSPWLGPYRGRLPDQRGPMLPGFDIE